MEQFESGAGSKREYKRGIHEALYNQYGRSQGMNEIVFGKEKMEYSACYYPGFISLFTRKTPSISIDVNSRKTTKTVQISSQYYEVTKRRIISFPLRFIKHLGRWKIAIKASMLP